MSNTTKLAPPWVTLYKEILALLGGDPDITVKLDAEKPEIIVAVTGEEKADALTRLLPANRLFGNVTCRITVLPANKEDVSTKELFARAFDGNPAFSGFIETAPPFAMKFMLFKKKVVQFTNDNMTHPDGVTTTLYEDIAKDLFSASSDDLLFCTEVNDG